MPIRRIQSRVRKAGKRYRYHRARVRRMLFTVGPDRLSRGRLNRRHLAGEVVLSEVEIESPRWPLVWDGLRILHVSDFHLGDLLPLDRALEIVASITRLKPDLVACTGDVVDLHHHDAPPLLEALGALAAPLGTMMVLGNHDELHCGETLEGMARRAGVTVLRSESAVCTNGDHTLTVAGIDWAKTQAKCARQVQRACGWGKVDLLLAHNPKAFNAAANLNIPLTLSGHTHGGQVALKGRPNANLALGHRKSAGVFEDGDSRLFVTTGIGAWFPLRVNCPAEVAMITMRRS